MKLRLRKKKYMKSPVLRQRFEELAQREEHAQMATDGQLRFGKFWTERVSTEDLAVRLKEIIEGEALPAP